MRERECRLSGAAWARGRLIGAQFLLPYGRAPLSRTQAYAAAPNAAQAALTNEFDAHVFEGLHHFDERIDVAPHQTVAGFHSLNGGQRQLCSPRKEELVYAQQGTRSTELRCSYHVLNIIVQVF